MGSLEDITSVSVSQSTADDTVASTSTTIVAQQVTKVTGSDVDFRAIWMAVKEDLKAFAPQIFGLLDSTHGRFNRERKIITLNIESGRTFAYDNLCKPAVKNQIISALEKEGLAGATIDVCLLEKGEEEKHSLAQAQAIAKDFASDEEQPSAVATDVSPKLSQPQFSDEYAQDVVGVTNSEMKSAPASDISCSDMNNPESSLESVHNSLDESSFTSVEDERNEVLVSSETAKDLGEIVPQSETIKQTNESLQVDNSKSEIDAFNEILASTFGEGAEFHEI